MTFRADLHCHTNCSDGSDTPLELLKVAKQVGLSALSITDHDTIDAYTPELLANASIELLTGVEISSELDGTSIHILGYNVDLNSDFLNTFLRDIQKARTERNRAIIDRLNKKNLQITEEELLAFAPYRTVGRPHIAGLLLKKGYVSSLQDAFERYLKESASCFVQGFKYSPADVITAIHNARGHAVLAHPHFLKNRSLIHKLLALPFDGIECYYSQLPKEQEAPWVLLAKKHNLIATGGSDYHGKIRPQTPLGCSWVNAETFRLLQKSFTDKS